MKIKYLLLTALISLLAPFSAYAAVGDVTGHIYTTDIAAYIDSMPVESFNIGGKTVVIAENLRNYGFYVDWHEKERWLEIKTEANPHNAPSYTHVPQKPGKIAGNIYETDIRVTVNSIDVLSHNLNGTTAIALEDMVDLLHDRYSFDGSPLPKPYSVTAMYYVWNNEARTISLYCIRPQGSIETDFGTFTVDCNRLEQGGYIAGGKSFYGMDGVEYNSWLNQLTIKKEIYVPLKELADLHNANVDVSDSGINLSIDRENLVQLCYGEVSTVKSNSNILYPLKGNLSLNSAPSATETPDFYAYKGQVYVSLEAVSSAAGKNLYRYRHELPEGLDISIGKILVSKHKLFVNNSAVNSYLADSGEFYISVDSLKDSGFVVGSTFTTREIKTPNKPVEENDRKNVPSSYYLSDYENKGYACEYYPSVHSVTVEGKPLSSVYIHYYDTHFTPCVPLSEFTENTGYTLTKEGENFYLYIK